MTLDKQLYSTSSINAAGRKRSGSWAKTEFDFALECGAKTAPPAGPER